MAQAAAQIPPCGFVQVRPAGEVRPGLGGTCPPLPRKNFDAVTPFGPRARARRHCHAELQRGGGAGKSRCGKICTKTVCGELLRLSSQREGAGQGALQLHALSVFAEALREQRQLGLGVDVVSGVGRRRKTQPHPRGGSDDTGARLVDLDFAFAAAAAGAGPGPLVPRALDPFFPTRRCEISPAPPSFGRFATHD